MTFLPFKRMWERANVAKQDSDVSYFFDLLYLGEMLTKITTAGLLGLVLDDVDRHRYRQTHRLVRSDALGPWAQAIQEITSGPTSQFLHSAAATDQRELTQRCGMASWQYNAVECLYRCVKIFDRSIDTLPQKIDALKWYFLFVELRNKTRGHGAIPGNKCSEACPLLEKSIHTLINNLSLFSKPWVYLHQNLSGKYRVSYITEDSTDVFKPLKSKPPESNMPDGVYIWVDQAIRIELLFSDPDLSDFFLPNGRFTDKQYDLISYLTDDKSHASSNPYMEPPTQLPISLTQGLGELEIQGQCFGNLPPSPESYIARPELETELREILLDDRHPVVTLSGRGGIGKTYLALSVLHDLAKMPSFDVIIWFSARDIDLLLTGPKTVKPHVMTMEDIANEFIQLTNPSDLDTTREGRIDFLSDAMTKGPLGSLLLVFDNFETIANPADVYKWVNTYIRLPNKILITTRYRDFRGDYYVEVSGMTEDQCFELINSTATSLDILSLLTDSYRQELYRESEGHPYVIKILLGEVARARKLMKVERIPASREDILEALFDRTYFRLSPAAKRIFLTLCRWRSVLPQLALEAVLHRPSNEKMDVTDALDELRKSSFVEVLVSPKDDEIFLNVPLAASVFGKKILHVSPMKSAVEADVRILFEFGAGKRADVVRGIEPRIIRLINFVAHRLREKGERIEEYLPMLEYIGRKYPKAWLLLASLFEELELENALERAKRAIESFLQSGPQGTEAHDAWQRLAMLYRRMRNTLGEVHAWLEMSELAESRFEEISNAVNRLNSLFRTGELELDTDEKSHLVRRFVQVMEGRINEGDANDCSRLAWLCLHMKDEARAEEFTQLGLGIDPNNQHCLNLARKFH